MNKTIIVTGGNVEEELLKNLLKKEAYHTIIAVDKGLESMKKMGIMPNHIVGDFDSVSLEVLREYENNSKVKIHRYISEKDNTDTEISIQLALDEKSDNITIIGAIGTRIDHVLANIDAITKALKEGVSCQIVDSHNKIQLINQKTTFRKADCFGKYISFLPYTEEVIGVTLKGFKYSLEKANMKKGNGLGVSNEIKEEIATVELEKGILIGIQSKD